MSHNTSLESLFKPHLVILYKISGTGSKKKKVQVKDIELRFLLLIEKMSENSNSVYSFISLPKSIYHNFSGFTWTYSSDLNQSISAAFCKTKKIKNMLIQKGGFHAVESCKNLIAIWLDGSMKSFVFH